MSDDDDWPETVYFDITIEQEPKRNPIRRGEPDKPNEMHNFAPVMTESSMAWRMLHGDLRYIGYKKKIKLIKKYKS